MKFEIQLIYSCKAKKYPLQPSTLSQPLKGSNTYTCPLKPPPKSYYTSDPSQTNHTLLCLSKSNCSNGDGHSDISASNSILHNAWCWLLFPGESQRPKRRSHQPSGLRCTYSSAWCCCCSLILFFSFSFSFSCRCLQASQFQQCLEPNISLKLTSCLYELKISFIF